MAGPKITMNSTGKKNRTIGTVSLGPKAAAFFSASAMRISRLSVARTLSAWLNTNEQQVERVGKDALDGLLAARDEVGDEDIRQIEADIGPDDGQTEVEERCKMVGIQENEIEEGQPEE